MGIVDTWGQSHPIHERRLRNLTTSKVRAYRRLTLPDGHCARRMFSPQHQEDSMRDVLKVSTRLLATAAMVALAACADQSPTGARAPDGNVHRVALGGTETLAGS